MKICSRRENSRADKNKDIYNSEEPLNKPRPERARFLNIYK